MKTNQPQLKEIDIKATTFRYLKPLLEDSQHRFKSWEHCYNAFGDANLSNDQKALHLAFYLASWGMYRGSSGLLWKDYTIHIPFIEELNKFQSLRDGNNSFELDVNKLFELQNLFEQHYGQIKYIKKNEWRAINPSDTLFSKIILGTLGCLPAFDNYFIKGLQYWGYSMTKNINLNTLSELNDIALAHKNEIISTQNSILSQTGVLYPYMKILDMVCWQLGYEQK